MLIKATYQAEDDRFRIVYRDEEGGETSVFFVSRGCEDLLIAALSAMREFGGGVENYDVTISSD